MKSSGRILIAASGAITFALLLSACASNATESHASKSHVTHSTTATPTPTQTLDSSEIFQTEPIAEAPAIVQQLEAMPMDTPEQVAAFNAIPKEDQLTWLSWATNDSIPEYASEYQTKSHDVNDVYPTAISIDDTPQQALNVGHYNIRVARSMATAADAQKALIASLPGGIEDGAYQAELVKLQLAFTPWLPISATIEEMSDADVATTVTNSPALQTDGSGRQYYEILSSYSFTNDAGTISSGNNIPNTAYYYTYKDFKGVEQSTWLIS